MLTQLWPLFALVLALGIIIGCLIGTID